MRMDALSVPIRFVDLLAPSIDVHIAEVESYSRNMKNAFTFRMKRWSYTRGANPAKFARWFLRAFRLAGDHIRGVFSTRGFTVCPFWHHSVDTTSAPLYDESRGHPEFGRLSFDHVNSTVLRWVDRRLLSVLWSRYHNEIANKSLLGTDVFLTISVEAIRNKRLLYS